MSNVVIIGSGLGGLTCGYILQKNGYRVTILEQGVQVGGCLQCFTRKGAKFETGMHFIGSAAQGQTMERVMRYFGLMADIELSALDSTAYNTVNLSGEEFRFPNGKQAFVEYFASRFVGERDALCRYVDIVDEIASASTLNSLTSAQRDLTFDTQYQIRSINDVLDTLFKDEELKRVLVGDLPLYSAELDKTPFSQHAFIMDFYNQSAFRIVGGSDSIAHSLRRSIELMGGQVLTQKRVVKIRCDEQRAVGVETHDEHYFEADYVISTVHPNRLLEMLDTKLIRPAFRSRISSLPQSAACFAVYVKFKQEMMPYMNTNYFGYSGPSPWNCEQYTEKEWPKGYLYMHMCHQRDAQWAQSGVILSYMNIDDVQQWQGSDVGRRGADYEAFKRERAERIIAMVDSHHSGFAQCVESYYTSTPLTYIDYTGTESGSMYGVAKDVRAGVSGRVPYRTKIPNLLLAGQNVNSHGMMGVIVGTIVACSELVPADKIYKQIEELNI